MPRTLTSTIPAFLLLSDNANKRWSDELLETFDISPTNSRASSRPSKWWGRSREFAALSGLAEGVPVVAGCGDTAASTFGSGMFRRSMVQDCAGTASVLCSVVDSSCRIPSTRRW